jgi:hypothetical protein
MACLRQQFVQDSELLTVKLVGERGDPGDIAARPIEAGDKTLFNRVESVTENDRNRIGCIFRCPSCEPAGDGHDHAHLTAHQIRG